MFSIVVPLWNKRDTVLKTVASVLAQTYGDFELIVVDDGSTDDSVDMLAGVDDPRLRILRQSNGGPGLARNAGIAAAKADWIAFLDADDLWLPDHLAELDRIRARFPKAGLIGTAYVQTDGSSSYQPPRRAPGMLQEINFFERIARDEPALSSSSAAVSRRAVETVGDFPADRLGQDMRYWMRIALAMPVAVSTRRTAIYRPLPTGLSASIGSVWRGRTLSGARDVSHQSPFSSTVTTPRPPRSGPASTASSTGIFAGACAIPRATATSPRSGRCARSICAGPGAGTGCCSAPRASPRPPPASSTAARWRSFRRCAARSGGSGAKER